MELKVNKSLILLQLFPLEIKKLKAKKKGKKKIEEVKSKINLDWDDENENKILYLKKKENESNGILPDVREDLEMFKKIITWKKIGKKNIPEPKRGIWEEFDTANDKVEDIKKSLQSLLTTKRKELKYSELKYCTTSRIFRFEFNIPNKMVDNLPEEYTGTTKSEKYSRFQTQELIGLVEQLEVAEEELREAISPFLSKLFRKFYKKQYLWSDYVAWIAELDCLMSLAEVSKTEDNMVKPIIVSRKEDASDRPVLQLKGVKHPWVQKTVKEFISNDVFMGEENPLVSLITGPNMGGKSTLLRQTWVAIIMCQIGKISYE